MLKGHLCKPLVFVDYLVFIALQVPRLITFSFSLEVEKKYDV